MLKQRWSQAAQSCHNRPKPREWVWVETRGPWRKRKNKGEKFMTIRKILAPVSGSPRDAEALHTAFRLARDLPAHVTVMFARMSPSESVPMVGEGVSSTVVEQLMTTAEQEWTRRATVARRHFDECKEKHGLPQRSAPSDPPVASVDWLEESGREDGVVRRLSLVHDLILLPNQTGSDDDLQFTLTFEGTLMAGCRPILLAPKIAGDTIGKSVAIAWNGDVPVARSVFAALPILTRADHVHVLTAGTNKTEEEAGTSLADYLAWHGITANTHRLDTNGRKVGPAVLETAVELDCDLLVMGGYGHSRMRELILGGVTRYMLSNATIAVLMAH